MPPTETDIRIAGSPPPITARRDIEKPRILTPAHLAVVAAAEQRGRPPSADCAIAYRLWSEARDIATGYLDLAW
jgi:hypothetical protein